MEAKPSGIIPIFPLVLPLCLFPFPFYFIVFLSHVFSETTVNTQSAACLSVIMHGLGLPIVLMVALCTVLVSLQSSFFSVVSF